MKTIYWSGTFIEFIGKDFFYNLLKSKHKLFYQIIEHDKTSPELSQKNMTDVVL
jgi:hypothetical protein